MPLRLRRKIKTEDEKREIARLFHAGYSSDSIAEHMNCSDHFVYVCAHRYPVATAAQEPEPVVSEQMPEEVEPVDILPEPAKTTHEKRNNRATPIEKQNEIIRLKTTTALSESAIVEQVGVSKQTVWRVWQKAKKADPSLELFKKPVEHEATHKKIPDPSVSVFCEDESLPDRAPAVDVTDEMRDEVMQLHEEEYANIFTIAEQLEIPVDTVRKIIKEDKGAYRRANKL